MAASVSMVFLRRLDVVLEDFMRVSESVTCVVAVLVHLLLIRIDGKQGYKADYPTDESVTTAAFILIIAKPWITCCQHTMRMCWASRERVECRLQGPL